MFSFGLWKYPIVRELYKETSSQPLPLRVWTWHEPSVFRFFWPSVSECNSLFLFGPCRNTPRRFWVPWNRNIARQEVTYFGGGSWRSNAGDVFGGGSPNVLQAINKFYCESFPSNFLNRVQVYIFSNELRGFFRFIVGNLPRSGIGGLFIRTHQPYVDYEQSQGGNGNGDLSPFLPWWCAFFAPIGIVGISWGWWNFRDNKRLPWSGIVWGVGLIMWGLGLFKLITL
jgi:hypothetical protein